MPRLRSSTVELRAFDPEKIRRALADATSMDDAGQCGRTRHFTRRPNHPPFANRAWSCASRGSFVRRSPPRVRAARELAPLVFDVELANVMPNRDAFANNASPSTVNSIVGNTRIDGSRCPPSARAAASRSCRALRQRSAIGEVGNWLRAGRPSRSLRAASHFALWRLRAVRAAIACRFEVHTRH